MTSFTDELKNQFKSGDTLTRLLFINLGAYLITILINVAGYLFQSELIAFYFVKYTHLPSDIFSFLIKPWTLITYMFLHSGFNHILFNLIMFYFSGKLFIEFLGGKRLLGTYLLGGIGGGLLFLIAYNTFPVFDGEKPPLVGASAAIMAVLMGIVTYMPQFPVRLFFLFEVRLWIIGLIVLFLDLSQIPQSNPGGHIAHLGGAAIGYLIVIGLRKGSDLATGFVDFWTGIPEKIKRKPRMKKVYSSPKKKKDEPTEKVVNQKKLDQILDKIKQSGYDGLTKEEKEFLFKFSQK